MLSIISKDGTKIAYEKSGTGNALLIIGGAMSDHRQYKELATSLSNHFEVYNYDRRGRGHSEDTLPYKVEKEIEDALSIIADIGKPVIVYGHSSGSALALHVTATSDMIVKLILADPPYTPHGKEDVNSIDSFYQELSVIERLNDSGDSRAATKFFLSSFGMTEEETENMLNTKEGEEMIATAHTLRYDYKLLGDGLVPNDLVSQIVVPTLILSPKDMSETSNALTALIHNASFEPMESSIHELNPSVISNIIIKFAQ